METITPSLQEEYKHYYSRLTDVVRRYLEEEAKISALESTTDELMIKLESLKQSGQLELEETIKNLKTVLQTADGQVCPSTPEFGSTSKVRELVEGVVIETKEALPEPTQEEIRERGIPSFIGQKKKKKTIAVGLCLVGILVILSLSVAIFVYGFYPVRDTLVGYPTIKLKNKEWITSQYGTPLLKFLLPRC